MLDLSETGARDWLKAVLPARSEADWPPAVRPLEQTPVAAELLRDLQRVLVAAGVSEALASLREPQHAQPLRDVLVHLGAARQLRLLHWLSEMTPGDGLPVAASLVMGDSAEAASLRAAIRAYARQGCLGRMLAPGRLEALHAATELALKEAASCEN